MRARLGDSVSGRYRPDENFLLTKHVVAAGSFAKDAGSTPAASTTFYAVMGNLAEELRDGSDGVIGRLGGKKKTVEPRTVEP
jgi:hypothetical protein